MFLAIVMAAAATLASDPNYTAAGGRDGVVVYVRKDSPIIDLVAIGDFAASPREVQAALMSYREHPGVLAHVGKSQILREQDEELVVYEQLKLPVVADRDYTIVVHAEPGQHGIRFHVANDQGPRQGKMVRITTLEGTWQLTPTDQGTHAIYRVCMDLGGSVPKGMVRNGSAKEIPDIFKAFRRLIEQRRAHAGNPPTAAR
jgi:hypothetical protein